MLPGKSYARLRKPLRLQGWMSWRDAALALYAAGSEVHFGTVPVERLWANIGKFIPKEAANISEAWWPFQSHLAFLRLNYRHFHKHRLPGWARYRSAPEPVASWPITLYQQSSSTFC